MSLEITVSLDATLFNYLKLKKIDFDVDVPINEFLELYDVLEWEIQGTGSGLFMTGNITDKCELWINLEG